MKCRFCQTELQTVFVDLYNSPASNSFLTATQLNEPETYFPLKVYACDRCFLVQVDEYKKSDAIFNSDYVYFSSFSKSWLAHSERYVSMMMERFGYNPSSLVIEVASNDGYLLQFFKRAGVPVLGIEPTANTAEVSTAKGIENVIDFFGERLANKLASEGKKADLLLGNNVLAHVPDINDFVGGMKIILNEKGVITMEFPHLMQLVDHNQFDTIYHEHFSYLSLSVVKKIFESKGLSIFDVEQLETHGGSLRIFACHQENHTQPRTRRVDDLLSLEDSKGLNTTAYYAGFQQRVFKVKKDFLNFLLEQSNAGKRVAGYGAAAKGNTLLNFCGVKSDLIEYVVDANPSKQNKFLPGSHIPVVDEARLKASKPDFVIIFPWNIKDEIQEQLKYIKEWGGQFVIFIPGLQQF